MSNDGSGQLVIISGPSGAGKSSVVAALLSACDLPLELSISATTRPPRPAEIDGVDYYFLSDEQFQQRRQAGEMLECFEVFSQGQWYGTLRQPVEDALARGKWLILEIDVNGAAAVLKEYPDAVTIFVHPGSRDELERRLRGRRTESDESIRRRLDIAESEMEQAHFYQYNVENRQVEQTAESICQLLKKLEERRCTKS